MTAPTPGVPGHDITRLPAGWSCSCGDGSGDSRKDEVSREMGIRLHLEDEAWRASLPTLSLPVLLDQYATAQQVRTRIGPKGTTSTRVHGRDRSLLLRAEIDRRIEVLSAAPSGETAPPPATVAWIPLSPLRRELIAYHAAMCDYGLTPAGEETSDAYDAVTAAGLALADAVVKGSLLPLGAAAATSPAEAYVQGYASAVYALRDDGRYAHWWSSAGHIPDGPARRHLADYLETVGPAAGLTDTPAGVAAASVPAAPNAQASPADILGLVRQYAQAIAAAAFRVQDGGPMAPVLAATDEADRLLDQIRTALAAPSGEQPTERDEAIEAIRREVYDNVYVNDDDGYPWLTCGLCGKRLVELEAGIEWPDLDRKVTGHDCAKPADQSGTEQVGEVPDHG